MTEKQDKKENQKPDWVKLKPSEIEELILDLAKKGNTPSKIGMILRDQHGIPKAKHFGIKIQTLLKKKHKEYRSETHEVKEKMQNIENHIARNKQDIAAKRPFTKFSWMLKTLAANS